MDKKLTAERCDELARGWHSTPDLRDAFALAARALRLRAWLNETMTAANTDVLDPNVSAARTARYYRVEADMCETALSILDGKETT
jgi:hypothetical protein